QFAGYQLIILGDGEAGSGGIPISGTNYNAAYANRGVWSSVITGRVVVSMQDPTYHAVYGSNPLGASTYLKAALNWASTGPGTGLYVGPDYNTRSNLDFLSGLGAWTTGGGGGDDVHILATGHGIVTGSSDASLS